MDSIPLCTRDASNNYKYHLPVKWDFREPFAAIVSSRGCKYSCAFCDVHKTFGREVRYRSVKNIIEEIAYLKERFKVKDIIFYDDTLTIDRERVIGLCRAIIDNNLSISWGCYSRVDALDEELVLSMKSAGCRMISFGVESGSQEMLKLMKKGIKLESALSAVALCNRCGIQTAASFVIGFPGETKETISETRSFVKKLDPLFATFFRFIPYPGTVFYQEYLKQENMDCMKIEDFQELGRSRILKVPGITEDEVNKSIRGIYLGFYFRPRKLIQHVFRLLRSPKLLGGYVKSLWWACTMRFKI
jgi:anaerobic magnesium-protoporphyrin IX monomethyl ester cyclase